MYNSYSEGFGLRTIQNTPQSPNDQPQVETNEAPQQQGLFLTPTKNGSFSGSENLAAVHRAEWDDYLARFAPTEDMLFDIFNDEQGRLDAVEEAGSNAGLAIDRSKQQADLSLSRYGVNLDQEKTEKRDRKYALDKALAVTGARNTQRDNNEKLKMGLMVGSSSTTKSNLGG